MLEIIIYFLALLNPFALFIYLLPLNKQLDLKSFINVLLRASLISYAIYAFFALFGNAFFTNVLKIDFNSFRIFGGLVLTAFALSFILQGKESMITIRGELSKMASEIALPFIVGAGTIALSIVVGSRLGAMRSIFALGVIILLNAAIVIALAIFRKSLKRNMQEVLDTNLETLLRVNGFIVGSFGIDLIATGVSNMIS